MKRILALLVVAVLLFSACACQSGGTTPAEGAEPAATDEAQPLITQDEAYNIYCDLIRKMIPEKMTEPQECDVDWKVHSVYTSSRQFIEPSIIFDQTVKMQSKKVGEELQYYLIAEDPEIDGYYFGYIDGDQYHEGRGRISAKTAPKESYPWLFHLSMSLAFYAPLFEQHAIRSFKTEKKDADTVLTFILEGALQGYDLEPGYLTNVMSDLEVIDPIIAEEISIVLTVDENKTPKTMATHLSLKSLDPSGEVSSSKIVDTEYTFNRFQNVEFDLDDVISQYFSTPTSAE